MRSIEHRHHIPLKNSSEFKSLSEVYFPNIYFNAYESDKLADYTFIKGIQQVVKEFACAEYRYRKRLAEGTLCNGYVRDTNSREKMPFIDGQYKVNQIESNIDDTKHGYSMQFFLPSGDSVSVDSLHGSVHQLGTFFGTNFKRDSLVLSVRLFVYRLDESSQRSNTPINNNPLIYKVVIPDSLSISERASESLAADFTANNAVLLVLR
ncbi:hypothetical protein NM22_17935 [Vibrio tubiashii]|nr:hypothetical protein NM22_17935 [Vibrio tubiashii]